MRSPTKDISFANGVEAPILPPIKPVGIDGRFRSVDTVCEASAQVGRSELTVPRLQSGSDFLGVFVASADSENSLPRSGAESAEFL